MVDEGDEVGRDGREECDYVRGVGEVDCVGILCWGMGSDWGGRFGSEGELGRKRGVERGSE